MDGGPALSSQISRRFAPEITFYTSTITCFEKYIFPLEYSTPSIKDFCTLLKTAYPKAVLSLPVCVSMEDEQLSSFHNLIPCPTRFLISMSPSSFLHQQNRRWSFFLDSLFHETDFQKYIYTFALPFGSVWFGSPLAAFHFPPLQQAVAPSSSPLRLFEAPSTYMPLLPRSGLHALLRADEKS